MLLKPLQPVKACILVIEDDPTVRANLQRLLAAEGYQPVVAEDRQSAAEGRIDLAIVGIAPGRQRDMLEDMLAAHRSVPVLALVDRKAWIGLDFFDVVNELGAAAVMQRPFPRTALLRLIAAVLSPDSNTAQAEDRWEDDLAGAAKYLPWLEDPHIA